MTITDSKDSARLDWLQAQPKDTLIKNGKPHGYYIYQDYFGKNRHPSYTVRDSLREAIDEAMDTELSSRKPESVP